MSTSSTSDPKRELLRHGLATLAYRGGKAIRGARLALLKASNPLGLAYIPYALASLSLTDNQN